MALATGKSSFTKILLICFALAFGLVALAMIYQGANNMGSADLRSRAGQVNQIYRQWEFDGKTTEGWSAVAPFTATVDSGKLLITAKNSASLPTFRNTTVKTQLPAGLKTISLSLAAGPVRSARITPATCPLPPTCMNGQLLTAVSPGSAGVCPKYVCSPRPVDIKPEDVVSDTADNDTFQKTIALKTACPTDTKECSDGTFVGRTGSGCAFRACGTAKTRTFTAQIYVKRMYQDAFDKPIEVKGTADGMMHTYSVNLPQAGVITIERIRVVFTSGLRKSDTVAVDWVRVLGPVQKPTPQTSCTMPPPCAYDTSKPCAYAVRGVTYCPITKPTPTPGTECKEVCTVQPNGVTSCVVGCPKPTPTPGTGCVTTCDATTKLCYTRCPATGAPQPTATCWCPGYKMTCPNGDVGLCPEPPPSATPFYPAQ